MYQPEVKTTRLSQAGALKETLKSLKTPEDILSQPRSKVKMAASTGDFPIGQATPYSPDKGDEGPREKKGDGPKVLPLYLANKPVSLISWSGGVFMDVH